MHIIRSFRLTNSRKHQFHAQSVRLRGSICHRINHKHYVVAQVESAACSRFHPKAGRNAREKNLGYAFLAQVVI